MVGQRSNKSMSLEKIMENGANYSMPNISPTLSTTKTRCVPKRSEGLANSIRRWQNTSKLGTPSNAEVITKN